MTEVANKMMPENEEKKVEKKAGKTASTSKVIFKRNVSHQGVFYTQGQQYELSCEDCKVLKDHIVCHSGRDCNC